MHLCHSLDEVFLVITLKNKVLSTTTQSVSFLKINLSLMIKITDTTVFIQISASCLLTCASKCRHLFEGAANLRAVFN